MPLISDRLWIAVTKVVQMKYPLVASLLRRNGSEYEAQAIEELVSSYEEHAGAAEREIPAQTAPEPVRGDARQIIEKLLQTCELNLDDTEAATREVNTRSAGLSRQSVNNQRPCNVHKFGRRSCQAARS